MFLSIFYLKEIFLESLQFVMRRILKQQSQHTTINPPVEQTYKSTSRIRALKLVTYREQDHIPIYWSRRTKLFNYSKRRTFHSLQLQNNFFHKVEQFFKFLLKILNLETLGSLVSKSSWTLKSLTCEEGRYIKMSPQFDLYCCNLT